ncbi:MAG: hypothetical protein KGQ58_00015 [Proteobacteria bacterium]|nr:hypothetical protein [Pseudomonadota bacterium]
MRKLERLYEQRVKLLEQIEEQRQDIRFYTETLFHPNSWVASGISWVRGLIAGSGLLWLLWPGRRKKGLLALALWLLTNFSRRRHAG